MKSAVMAPIMRKSYMLTALEVDSRYCSAKCQRSAWAKHKGWCTPAAASAASNPSGSATIPAVLLGRQLKADIVLVPKPPFTIADVRHLFTEHAGSKDSDFINMPMPFTKRLFQRDIHIMFDRSMLPGGSAHSSAADDNAFAMRAAASLSTGFGPPIRNQALLYDPTGAPYYMGDFLAYDDIVFNSIMDKYSDSWCGRTPTEAELDRAGERWRRAYNDFRRNYTDVGTNKAAQLTPEEEEEAEMIKRANPDKRYV